jgi:hypothetical protein
MTEWKHKTIWVVKYALSKGIYSVKARECGGGAMYVLPTTEENAHFAYYLHGKDRDWCWTEAQAKQRALEMIEAKRRSIQKQLAKLAKLEKEYSRDRRAQTIRP